EKPDFVMINSWSYFSDWLVIFSSLFLKTKLCLRFDNPLSHEKFKSKWKVFLKKIILGFLFRKVDYFFYVGYENRKFINFYAKENFKMIFTPHAVDNDYFEKEYQKLKDKKEELRKIFNIPQNDIVLLFVGKLIKTKNPLDLLLAYEIIYNQKNIKNISLVYVGEGELKKDIEKFIKEKNLDKVFLVGFQSQKELPKFYSLADIFILPSGLETWGLVVNEAMNFDLPIIVSNLVGCGPDLVKEGENGHIFKAGDIGNLIDSILKLINNKNIYGQNSKKIIKNYTYQKSAENILKIINL
ncbi:MAG: glycosyltransferase family 4 protein, partial [Candidatus Goldbacteria bacterium]|nr:glycosyltransferase family 4 protein [Candidatus Goldiibacteriota bacterium]